MKTTDKRPGAEDYIRSLLYDDVIDNTYSVMTNLRYALEALVGQGKVPGEELKKLLLEMTSESIREALHKRELAITNAVIRAKLELLRRGGVEPGEGHGVIDPDNYPDYDW